MKVSIIIPVYNQYDMTMDCLDSIIEHSSHMDYEVVIIDNGSEPAFSARHTSTDEYKKYHQLIRNDENKGFPAAVNQGIRAAAADIICLLNNDTVVTSNWLDYMIKRLDEYSIVSPVTNYCAGVQRVSISEYHDEQSLNMAAMEHSGQNKEVTQEVNFVIGFCMLFRKSLFDEIGEFDESMWPSSGEEIDFCFRARKAGHKVAIARDVYIHHYGSQTFEEMHQAGQVDYPQLCRECDAHLAERWGSDFWHKQALIQGKAVEDTGIKLNLGCGRYKLSGFINIDEREEVDPDLIADALKLPFKSGEVDEIYCGHMLEHLTLTQGIEALQYWNSLLKPDGKISIVVPDFDVFAKQYIDNPSVEKLIELNDVYIYSYCQSSHHKYCYNGDLLKKMMGRAGFIGIQKMPKEHPYYVDAVDWQIGYQGVKA